MRSTDSSTHGLLAASYKVANEFSEVFADLTITGRGHFSDTLTCHL